jgi:3-deoxy-7-phosphoheptulonate synthase
MIVMKPFATDDEVRHVVQRVEGVGARAHVSRGEEVTVIGAVGDREHVARLGLEAAAGVDKVVPILKPYKLASSQLRRDQPSTHVIGGRKVGGEHFALIAGPCTVESRDQTLDTARIVAAAGATMFRGGAYKPRTSPYSFQGSAGPGLRILAEAREETGPADRHRADGHERARRDRRGRRRHPDRRAQHAELRAADRGRAAPASP